MGSAHPEEIVRAFAAFVIGQLYFKLGYSTRRRIKAHVLFKGGKMDHIFAV